MRDEPGASGIIAVGLGEHDDEEYRALRDEIRDAELAGDDEALATAHAAMVWQSQHKYDL